MTNTTEGTGRNLAEELRAYRSPRRSSAKDNARLIAAAPDLLEALKFIRSVARFAHFPEADAAIAKAEGRS